jgi:hypothetical protein
MPEPTKQDMTDEAIAVQLRSYAQGVEHLVPPTPVRESHIRFKRAAMAVAAVAAALVAVVAGAVVLASRSGDDLVVTPADQGQPDGASASTTEDSTAVPPNDEPCPGVMVTLDQTATADPGFPVEQSKVLGYMPFRFRVEVIDADEWVELAVDYPSFGKVSDAPVIDTVPVTICNPMSDSTEPVEVQAQILDTPDPTVHVFVDNPLPPGEGVLIVLSGGPGTTVENLLSAISTFRWANPPPPTTTTVTGSDPPLRPAVDDDRLIAFGRVAGFEVGREVPVNTGGMDVSSDFGGLCGYWNPVPPSELPGHWDGMTMLVTRNDDPDLVTVGALYISDPGYRTASGVGLGTDLESLQRVYGSDLVVDRADGWENPTDGLLASYKDVAAVRDGDRALTFTLENDVVIGVKVSDADFWGDDEGCA